jgi:hypothetical protein
MYVVYTPLLRKTRSDSVTAGLRNGIVIKYWVGQCVAYVVICRLGSVIPWFVAGYPMVEVCFVWCVMRDGGGPKKFDADATDLIPPISWRMVGISTWYAADAF